MQWLVANMWIALAVCGVLGMLFGSSVRGLMSARRVRRATVERDVMKTELEQTRVEVDELYAAQRKRQTDASQAVSGDGSHQVELEARETKITDLTRELDAARTELDSLKSERESTGGDSALAAAGGAIAGAAATALASSSDDGEAKALQERNEWLEARVAALETDLSSAQEAVASAQEVQADETAIAEMSGDNEQLRSRIAELEAAAATAATVATTGAADAGNSEADEELARLRWRNRFLEGRLAYFEGGEAPEDESADDTLTAEDEAPVEASDQAPIDAEPAEAEVAEEDVSDSDEKSEEAHPSDAILKALDEADDEAIQPVEPAVVDAPSDGGGDDLAEINGITTNIAEQLNEIGIWSFAQIAQWSSANVAWVDEYLSLNGRIERENWLDQAEALAKADA